MIALARRLSAILFAMVIGTAGARAGEPVTLVAPQLDEPRTLSPDFAPDTGAYPPASNIYSTLFTLDWGLLKGTTAYGDLADHWEVAPDGLTITFHLRPNMKWHDGAPVTSADVKFTYDTIIRKKYPFAPFLRNVTSVETPDDLTVVLKLGAVDVSTIPMMAQASQWWGKIYPKHLWASRDGFDTGPYLKAPVGSGPFRFVRWDSAGVEVAANPDYFLGKPRLDRVIFKHVGDANVARAQFDAGDYPWLPFDYAPPLAEVASLQADPSVKVIFTPSHYSRALYLNFAYPPYANQQVRYAIAMAMDREAINRLAFSGFWRPDYTASIETQANWINPEARFPTFDRAGAEKLLDAAGFPRKAGGWRFSTTVIGQPLADCLAMLPVIVQQLRAVGIDATARLFDQTTYFQMMFDGKWETSCYASRFGPDPDAYREHFATTGSRNFMHYSNAEVDDLARRGVATLDPAARRPLYQRIQELIVRDVAFINLFNEQKTSLERPGWTGFPTDADGFNTSMTWYGLLGVRPPPGP
jgi:peptide/nickel transport system substrate-binding protein